MKATGEVMAIERNIEAGLLKAIRSLEIGLIHLDMPEFHALSDEEVLPRFILSMMNASLPSLKPSAVA